MSSTKLSEKPISASVSNSDYVIVSQGVNVRRAPLGAISGGPDAYGASGYPSDDTAALQAAIDAEKRLTFPKRKTYGISGADGLKCDNASLFGGGSVFRATANNTEVLTFKRAPWWGGSVADDDEQKFIRDLTIDGNGMLSITGIHAEGALRLFMNNVRVKNVKTGARLNATIFGNIKNLSVEGNLDVGVSVKNNASAGGNILSDFEFAQIRDRSELFTANWVASTAYSSVGALVKNDSGRVYELLTAGVSASSGGPTGNGSSISDGSCVWKYRSPSIGFSVENISTDSSLGFGADELHVSVEHCGGPGFVAKGRVSGGAVDAKVRIYNEATGLRSASEYPITQDGITIPERCCNYITDNASITMIEPVLLPGVGQDDGHNLLIGASSRVTLVRPKPFSVGALNVRAITCPDGSYCEIVGEFTAMGRGIRNVNLEQAIPFKTVTGGGFSAWGRRSFAVRESRWFQNKFAESGGDSWFPAIDVSGTSNPATVAANGYTDSRFGKVARITFGSTVGTVSSNRGAITVFDSAAAVAGESFGVRVLARLISGTATVRHFSAFGGAGPVADAELTTEWQEIFLIAQASASGSTDRTLYIYPQTSGGADVLITCVGSRRSSSPQDLADLLRGECTPRNRAVAQASSAVTTGTITNGSTYTTTVSVVGAALGDFVDASCGNTLQGLSLTAYVSASDTVTLVITNNTGASKSLTSETIMVRVTRGI